MAWDSNQSQSLGIMRTIVVLPRYIYYRMILVPFSITFQTRIVSSALSISMEEIQCVDSEKIQALEKDSSSQICINPFCKIQFDVITFIP